jgi:hypothetical protein
MTISLNKLFSIFKISYLNNGIANNGITNNCVIKNSVLKAMYANQKGKSLDTILCCLFANIDTEYKENNIISNILFPSYLKSAIENYPIVENDKFNNTMSNKIIEESIEINNEFQELKNIEYVENDICNFIEYVKLETEKKCNEEFVNLHIR